MRLIKHLAFVALSLLLAIPAWAYDFEVDGIYYNIISDVEPCRVEVTYREHLNPSYSGEVVIPETITNVGISYSVTSIGISAFYGCRDLTSIEIPNSVTSIESGAFQNCSGLTSVTIPKSVTFFGIYPLEGCSSLEQIVVDEGNQNFDSREGCNAIIRTVDNTLVAGCKNSIIPNSVTTLGLGAFCGCTTLTSIAIPNSVTSIEEAVFYGCSSLTSVIMPNSLTVIRNQTFYSCMALTSIEIPESVNSIGEDAFNTCRSLTSVDIPNAVTSIGNRAFKRCYGLTSVTIPNSVTSIGDNAFDVCRFLKEVIVEALIPPICGDAPFPNQNVSIYVPCDSKEVYANADVWRDYPNIFGIESLISLVVRSCDESLGTARISHQPDCENRVATVLAEPIGDNLFLGWMVNGQVVSTANPYSFLVEEDIELVANFQGTGVGEASEQRVSVSPNPTKDLVVVECENLKGISVYTLDGRMTKTNNGLNADVFTLDMSDVPQGIYVLRVETREGTVINRKIIKK